MNRQKREEQRNRREEQRNRRWLIAAPPSFTIVAECNKQEIDELMGALDAVQWPAPQGRRLIELHGKLQMQKVEAWIQWRTDLEQDYTWSELAEILDVQVCDLESMNSPQDGNS